MEQKKLLNKILNEKVIPPGTKIREIPWKQLVVRMTGRVEEAGKLLNEKRRPGDIRIQKKLGMMRLSLLNQMHAAKMQEVDITFLLDTIELLNRMEEMLEQYEHDVTEWMEFLQAIEKKLEDEGILLGDKELTEQAHRLQGAIDKLKAKLEAKEDAPPSV